jgi:hypothetical protein
MRRRIKIRYALNNRQLTKQSRPIKPPFLLIAAIDLAVVPGVLGFDNWPGQCYRALTLRIIRACIQRGRKWCGVCGALA